MLYSLVIIMVVVGSYQYYKCTINMSERNRNQTMLPLLSLLYNHSLVMMYNEYLGESFCDSLA